MSGYALGASSFGDVAVHSLRPAFRASSAPPQPQKGLRAMHVISGCAHVCGASSRMWASIRSLACSEVATATRPARFLQRWTPTKVKPFEPVTDALVLVYRRTQVSLNRSPMSTPQNPAQSTGTYGPGSVFIRQNGHRPRPRLNAGDAGWPLRSSRQQCTADGARMVVRRLAAEPRPVRKSLAGEIASNHFAKSAWQGWVAIGWRVSLL